MIVSFSEAACAASEGGEANVMAPPGADASPGRHHAAMFGNE